MDVSVFPQFEGLAVPQCRLWESSTQPKEVASRCADLMCVYPRCHLLKATNLKIKEVQRQ
jgi:hypothetical protein